MHWTPSFYTSVSASYSKLLHAIKIRPHPETISVEESLGRVLWTDIRSKIEIPSMNCSHMDGFAVRFDDIRESSRHRPAELRVVSKRSENGDNQILLSGESIRISTGNVLPRAADTIIPIENTQFDSKNRTISIQSCFPRGSFVSYAGDEIRRNDLLLNKRHILRAQDLALLSIVGIRKLRVLKKPRVAIIPTGSDLTEEFTDIKLGKVLNTNSGAISKLIEASGGLPLDLGITPDHIDKIKIKIKVALSENEIILTTGGSSVGFRDLVAESVKTIGEPGILVHGIKLDRGRVTGLAALRNKPIIILPGPVQGAVNAFIVFVQPLIRSMLGLPSSNKPLIVARLARSWAARKKFQNFTKILYVKISQSRSGQFQAFPITGETTDITVLTKSNGFILVPEQITNMKKGQLVRISIVPGLSFSSGINM